MKRLGVLGVAVLLCILAWWVDRRAFLGAYLAAWWFWVGVMMGGLANVWMHNLTGGKWGEVIRVPLLRASGSMWLAAILFLPILLGLPELYSWAVPEPGQARWTGELSAPAFKRLWLTPGFFTVRSVLYLLLWCALVWLSQRPRWQRSQGFAAFALIVYGFSVSLAAVDWLMSLMPLWYSSVFGWLAGVGQMLGGMAAAIVWAALSAKRLPPTLFRDLGNLLLMYVMTWAYLAFVQFLIIWAENLPNEIGWYLQRNHGPWLVMAWMLAICMFAAPLLILLFRQAKDSPRWLGWLAAGMLLMKLIDCWWLVLPSVAVPTLTWLWAAPLGLLVIALVAWLCWQPLQLPALVQEERHG